MRFCPFCAAENQDEATHCSACARKLPPARPSSVVPAVPPAAAATETAPAATTTPAFPPPPPAKADATPTRRVAPANAGPRELTPFPEPPETGLIGDARYVLALLRARWQRRVAVMA